MNMKHLALSTLLLLAVGIAVAQAPGSPILFTYGDMQIQAPTFRSRVRLAPVITLLGGEMRYSEAAGVWALAFGDHLIQISPDRKLLLVDGKLLEAREAPLSAPDGVAVSMDYLRHYILAPFGLHLEALTEGWAIREGASFAAPVGVHPIVADFGATTTLVLALDEPADAEVISDPDGRIKINFLQNSPQLDNSRPFKSRNILEINAAARSIELLPAGGVGLISKNFLHSPERVVLELGPVRPTPTPAPEQAPPPPVHRSGPPLIVIDPGHGGSDTGAIGPTGLVEKELTLQVASRLASELIKMGYSVRLTRNRDEGRALTDRVALANRLEAALFVSLHANSSTAPSVRGAETYYMSLSDKASDAAAQNTAAVENAVSDEEEKPSASSLDLILWDMAQSEVLNESAALALDIQIRLNALLGIKDRGVKQAPFVVLTGATMPAALVEIGFLSNAEEAAQLKTPAHQGELARAIALGIRDFLRSR